VETGGVDLVERLAACVADLLTDHARVLVGIDGPDAAGKTTMADRLAGVLTVPVVRASVDEFHRPRVVRQQKGSLSPEGYYEDCFNYPALIEQLLSPFTEGSTTVVPRCFDYVLAQPVEPEPVAVPEVAVLVFDGVFLLRPELRDWWTLSIYLRVPEEVTLARALVRDVDAMGSEEEIERRYRQRYLPGQALYWAGADPERTASIVIENSHPNRRWWCAGLATRRHSRRVSIRTAGVGRGRPLEARCGLDCCWCRSRGGCGLPRSHSGL
jgi:uridine kinase